MYIRKQVFLARIAQSSYTSRFYTQGGWGGGTLFGRWKDLRRFYSIQLFCIIKRYKGRGKASSRPAQTMNYLELEGTGLSPAAAGASTPIRIYEELIVSS